VARRRFVNVAFYQRRAWVLPARRVGIHASRVVRRLFATVAPSLAHRQRLGAPAQALGLGFVALPAAGFGAQQQRRPVLARREVVRAFGGRERFADERRILGRKQLLVPKPRKHLVTYHGVLAPASGLRSRVVPRREEEGEAGGCQHGAGDGPAGQEATAVAVAKAVENVDAAAFQRQQAERRVRARLRVPHGGGRRGGGRRRYSWAKLLQRALGIEVLVCPKCSGIRRVLAAIHDPASIARVLGAMGLFPSGDPELAASRAPPGRDDGQAE
jgi:hypothetical protein